MPKRFREARKLNKLKLIDAAKLLGKFVINDGGYVELTDIVTVVGTPHPLLHSELRRVMLSSPQWQPATKDGRAVAFEATLPVTIAN